MIEVSNLTKKYNNVVVLDNISFSVTDTTHEERAKKKDY